MARTLSAVAAMLVGTLLSAGCSSDEPSAADPSSSPSDSPSASPSPSPTASSPTTSTAPVTRTNNCLFGVASVSRALGGSWKRHPAEGEACAYTSDRGATFATHIVDQAIEPGLRDARHACVQGVRPISIEGGGFVCVEETSSGDLVVGNIAAHGLLWLAVIVPDSEGPPRAELAALVALLESVRP